MTALNKANYYIRTVGTRIGLKCQTPVKVKIFALASLDSLKFRSYVFSLQRSSFMKFILGLQKMLSLKKISGLKIFGSAKNFGSEKNVGPKKF